MMPKALFLYEEVMLLALRAEKGTLAADETKLQYTLGASLLSDLLLRKRAGIGESKKKLVDLLDSEPIGDPLLDECLRRLQSAKRRGSVKTWVSRFSKIKKLKHQVAKQLCSRGILRADEDKILLIFTRKLYPQLDPRPERQLVERLRKAIFTDARHLDPHTAVLVSLAQNADLLKNVFDKKELKHRKARIKQVINGELTGKAAREAAEAIQAAVVAAVMVTVFMGD